MGKVFISYSRIDNQFAQKLATGLSKYGFDIWLDLEDIPTGMNWSNAIQQGLDTADAMIIILSPDSMKSPNVENEWQYFFDQGKPLIPVMLRETNVHFQLHRLQHINFLDEPFPVSIEKLKTELALKGITQNTTNTATQKLEQADKALPDTSSNKRGIWLWSISVIIIGTVTIGLGASFFARTPSVELSDFPIYDTMQLSGDIPYEFTLNDFFSDLLITDADITFNVLGMTTIDGTIDVLIPGDTLASANISGDIPIDEDIPINLLAQIGFQDEDDDVVVIANLDINDTIPVNLLIPIDTQVNATFTEGLVISGISTSLQINDGTEIAGELSLTFASGFIIPLDIEVDIPVDYAIDIVFDVSNTTRFAKDRVPDSIQISDTVDVPISTSVNETTRSTLTEPIPFVVTARFEPADGSSALEGTILLTLPRGYELDFTVNGTIDGNIEVPLTIDIPTNPDNVIDQGY